MKRHWIIGILLLLFLLAFCYFVGTIAPAPLHLTLRDPLAAITQKGGVTTPASNSLYRNLIAYWDMDETSGNRAAAFAGEGSDSLTLTDTNTVGFDSGKLRNSGLFIRANTEYLTIADNAQLSMGDIDFTIAAWVTFSTLPAAFNVFGIVEKFTPGGEREYDLDMQETAGGTTYRFVFAVRDVADSTLTIVQASSFGSPATATYYWVVAYHDSVNNLIGIQINNGTADTNNTTGGVRNGTAPFRIGAFGNATSALDGAVDMACVWKRLLSADEKAYLYNSGNGRSPL